MRKKFLCVISAITVMGMLCACGSSAEDQSAASSGKRAGAETAEETTAATETETETESEAENIVIKESPDKYTWYMQNYVGLNLANVGYTSMGGDRMDHYGAGYIELCLVTDDGSYIDISDDEDLQQYMVVAQSLEPNTEIKYTFETDSEGNEYDSLVAWQNIEQIDLLLKHVGSELSSSAPELVAINPSPDKYTSYIRNYVGKNAGLVGYTSLGGNRMDAYGGGYLELVLAPDDGSYIDLSDDSQLSQYVITGQNIEPNTALTMTFTKDSSGEEYDNLVDSQNYESITLKLKKISNSSASSASGAGNSDSSKTSGASATGSTGTKSGSSDKDSNGVSKEFKETMDAYEAFFDEYVEFMQDYDGTDLNQLTEYAGLMTTYAEYMQEMAEIEDEELSDADYAYYVKVNGRILEKLATIE